LKNPSKKKIIRINDENHCLNKMLKWQSSFDLRTTEVKLQKKETEDRKTVIKKEKDKYEIKYVFLCTFVLSPSFSIFSFLFM